MPVSACPISRMHIARAHVTAHMLHSSHDFACKELRNELGEPRWVDCGRHMSIRFVREDDLVEHYTWRPISSRDRHQD